MVDKFQEELQEKAPVSMEAPQSTESKAIKMYQVEDCELEMYSQVPSNHSNQASQQKIQDLAVEETYTYLQCL